MSAEGVTSSCPPCSSSGAMNPRPHDLGRFRHPLRFTDQANPKIAQPEFMAHACEQDVLRLDIAMNDLGRMSGAQRARDLLGDLQHAVDGVLVQAEAASIAQVTAPCDWHDKKLLFSFSGAVESRVIDQGNDIEMHLLRFWIGQPLDRIDFSIGTFPDD